MTESEIHAVLAAAFENCPEDVADTLLRWRLAQGTPLGSKLHQDFKEALSDLAGTVAFYTRQGSEVLA